MTDYASFKAEMASRAGAFDHAVEGMVASMGKLDERKARHAANSAFRMVFLTPRSSSLSLEDQFDHFLNQMLDAEFGDDESKKEEVKRLSKQALQSTMSSVRRSASPPVRPQNEYAMFNMSPERGRPLSPSRPTPSMIAPIARKPKSTSRRKSPSRK